MKTKLTITVLLVLLTLAFIFKNPSEISNNILSSITESSVSPLPVAGGGNNFVYGAFNSGYDFNFEYDALGFNIWHTYGFTPANTDTTRRHYPPGWQHPYWVPGDSLFADYNTYVGGVQGVLSEVNTERMNVYQMRSKIEWLRCGQRSDYQCEAVHENGDYWFYTFNDSDPSKDINDNSPYGQNERVKYMQVNPNQTDGGASWVVKRLKANSEQGLPYGDKAAYGDNECTWLIKPKIRIDSLFASNPANLNTPVCSLTVKNQDGNTFKNVVLRVRNFLVDTLDTYNGRYIEEYKFILGDSALTYTGKWGTGYLFEARGTSSVDPNTLLNKADIQVYWYGNCDMWIDYVRVDNDIADELFKGQRNDWLEWEGRDIASNSPAVYRYYIELFEFNNIPCIEYIFRKLDSLSGRNITLVATPSIHLFAGHVPWSQRLTVWNTGYFKRNFLDKVGATEFMLASYPFTSAYRYPESYPNYNTWSKIPNTLPRFDTLGTLALAVNPGTYDDWLQGYLDGAPYSFESGYSGGVRFSIEEDPGNFRYILQFADAISKETGLPFIFHSSAHSWYLGAGTNDVTHSGAMRPMEITGEVQREPTNEELDMISNISLTYGAKGLMWFEMTSSNTNPGDVFYSRGILDKWVSGNNLPPRYTNAYGQPKWDKLISISDRMKAWEPYIMSFDNANRHSYIYRLDNERYSCIQNTYFRDIVSYEKGTGYPPCSEDSPDTTDSPNPPDLRYECNESRYLQVATFKGPSNDFNKYFMIVNRRCSPVQADYNDGRRYVRVMFDQNHNDFAGYNNWNIINVETGQVINVVNIANITPYADLDWFNPGEGKLFKIEAVPKSGGILVADENISGTEFTCEAPVYNNGHNITIGANTTIHFTDSAKFVKTFNS